MHTKIYTWYIYVRFFTNNTWFYLLRPPAINRSIVQLVLEHGCWLYMCFRHPVQCLIYRHAQNVFLRQTFILCIGFFYQQRHLVNGAFISDVEGILAAGHRILSGWLNTKQQKSWSDSILHWLRDESRVWGRVGCCTECCTRRFLFYSAFVSEHSLFVSFLVGVSIATHYYCLFGFNFLNLVDHFKMHIYLTVNSSYFVNPFRTALPYVGTKHSKHK